MKFLFISALFASPIVAQECATTWKCHFTSSPPVLDGSIDDWASVNAYTTSLVNTVGTEYDAGTVTYKCQYDAEKIYFAMDIPGEYGFDSTDNHLCASIATMMKVGASASFVNMGGCPDAMGGCPNSTDTCSDYLVDIGAHWELKDTNQATLYGLAASPASKQGGTVAKVDDEYAFSPYCRNDDDDEMASDDWSGAWSHTNPIQGESGNYIFEVSRPLSTQSTVTDAQLAAGDTVQFGLAFWDPFDNGGSGWSDIGHYVTGCGTKWIDLELVPEGQEGTMQGIEDAASDTPSSAVFSGASVAIFLAVLTGFF